VTESGSKEAQRAEAEACGAARTSSAVTAGKLVLGTLAVAQFLMALDSSVMNVSIAYVSQDVHTTVAGVQAAITMYTLVMAALMVTGGRIGAIIGRRRAFAIGCVVYGTGAAVTSIAGSLPILMIGWSLIEGMGAALIMPACVALVAANVPPSKRPAAYGMLTAAVALAIAAGPLIGGAVTTWASWRWVFAGETIIVIPLLLLTRRMVDTPPEAGQRFDVVGFCLSVAGLGATVYGVLRTGEWGWVHKVGAPKLLGISPSFWLILGGLIVCYVFIRWEARLERHGGQPLIRPSMLLNRRLTGGLLMSFFQFLVQGGVGFVISLFLSIVLGLSALMTGFWLFPLSVALLIAAAGIPNVLPKASPCLVVRVGLMLFMVGVVVLMVCLEPGAGAHVVVAPLVLMGLGAGCMASQIGAVTVSAVPDDQTTEVGGLQSTVSNLGSSLATALTGSVLIATLSASFLAGIVDSPKVPEAVKKKSEVQLAAGIPFVSNDQLRAYMRAEGASAKATRFVLADNEHARLKGLQTALSLVAGLCVVALFFTGRLPRRTVTDEGGAGPPRGPAASEDPSAPEDPSRPA